jgi:hypothetical protein
MAGRKDIRAGGAFVEMFVQNKRLIRGLRNAQARLRSFGAGVRRIGAGITAVGAVITATLGAMVKHFAQAGDALDKMSARVGVSVEFLSALSHAADLGGSNIDDLEKGVRRLQRSAFDASQGLKAPSDAFDMLGVSVTDTNGALKDTEALFLDTVAALSAVESHTEKAALAQILFGRSGTALLPMLKGGKEALLANMEAAQQLGIVMSTEDADAAAVLTDAWTKLWAVLKTVTFQIGSALAGDLTTLIDRVTENASVAIQWVKDNKGLIITLAKLAVGVLAAGAAITAIGTAIIGLSVVVGAAASAVVALNVAAGIAATVIGAILSPVGLVTAALVGLVAYFGTTSGFFRKTADWIGEGFEDLKETATAVFGGIADAMRAGDMKLAAKILWAGIKVAWTGGLNWLRDQWDSFVSWFSQTTIGQTFITMVGGMRAAWAGLAGEMRKLFREAEASAVTGTLARFLLNLEEDPVATLTGGTPGRLGRKGGFADPQKQFAPVTAQSQVAGVIQASRDTLTDDLLEIDADTKRIIDQIGKQTGAQLRGDPGSGAAGRAAELARLQAELGGLIERASQAASAARVPGRLPGTPGAPGPPLPEPGAIQRSAAGTFSTAQAALLGGVSKKNILEVLAKQAEIDRKELLKIDKDMLRETRDLNRAVA